MLELKNISKVYGDKGDSAVRALNGITLRFRKSEFVSVLGQSGCGKTTLLNIIGGLDRYTSGDLIIDGTSTRDFTDKQWDTYRNHSVGFVFQSYNLIPHQTILENVELTMTIGGLPKAERKKRAKQALVDVGLGDKLNKKPNQLSGGQMQRVSIARALVGDPDIILADEPTGALDNDTGKTIMRLLKDISKTRLVIMVTHNPLLAEEFSDRVISMLDGEVTSDTDPFDGVCDEAEKPAPPTEMQSEGPAEISAQESEQAEKTTAENASDGGEPGRDKLTYKKKHSSMSFLTAMKLSGKNLLSKKSRTLITSFAASIGVIGVAIILSLSAGMSTFIDRTMMDSTSFNYLSMTTTYVVVEDVVDEVIDDLKAKDPLKAYPKDATGIYPYVPEQKPPQKTQEFSEEFVDYLKQVCDGLVVDVAFSYKVALNILTKNGGKTVSVPTKYWLESLNNYNFLSDKYTVLSLAKGAKSGIPAEVDEVALVVDKYNRLSTDVLKGLGIPYTEDLAEIKYEDIVGKEFRVVFNDGWYTEKNGVYQAANSNTYDKAYDNENGITVKIVSVLREEQGATPWYTQTGIVYSPKLTEAVLENNKNSAVALAQAESKKINVLTGKAFSGNTTYDSTLKTLGYDSSPDKIIVYPKDVNAREKIMDSIKTWNATHDETQNIYCLDMSSMLSSTLGKVVDIITFVLIVFSSISLVISSIMIAIIIYASVIERTKEIGVLRSIGARKKDISRVFIAEAGIIGTLSGVMAILLTLAANAVINAVVKKLLGVAKIATLTPLIAISMILLSVCLLLIASLIPAYIAAKKQPAVALRTE